MTSFLSCDWGTTNFRLRRVEGGRVLNEVRSDEGTAKLAAAGGDRAAAFRGVLEAALSKLGGRGALPIVISGMASSSIGWCELPYARLPFRLDGRDAMWKEIEEGVYLLSGLRSDVDILRGEETEAIGAAALPGVLESEAVLVKPGTHSKHLQIRDGKVTGFQSFMTGEVYDVMSRHSVLRHSVDPAAEPDRAAFLEGVRAAGRPLTSGFFRVRTRQVLEGSASGTNASYLSGLLVGVEVHALREAGGLPIVLAGTGRLAEMYAWAFGAVGLEERVAVLPAQDVERLSVLGQAAVLSSIAR